MFGWISSGISFVRSFLSGKLSGNITIYFFVLLGLVTIIVFSTPKILSLVGFVSEKDRLLVKVTDQTSIINKLTEENKKLSSELLKYQEIASVNEKSLNDLKEERAKDAIATKALLDSKEAKIKDILSKENVNKIPDSCVKYKDVTVTLPKAKIDQISKMQIDSIWSNYEKSVTVK